MSTSEFHFFFSKIKGKNIVNKKNIQLVYQVFLKKIKVKPASRVFKMLFTLGKSFLTRG